MGPSKNVRFIDGRAADSGEYQTNTEACILMHENSGLLEGPGWVPPAKPPVVNDSMDVDGDNAGHPTTLPESCLNEWKPPALCPPWVCEEGWTPPAQLPQFNAVSAAMFSGTLSCAQGDGWTPPPNPPPSLRPGQAPTHLVTSPDEMIRPQQFSPKHTPGNSRHSPALTPSIVNTLILVNSADHSMSTDSPGLTVPENPPQQSRTLASRTETTWDVVESSAVSQSVDLGWSNNPNTTPTKDYEIVQVVVYLRSVQRGCAEEGERGSTPTG